MKFSSAISTLILALPLLVEAIPSDVDARQVSRQRGGGNANAGKASTAAKGAAAAKGGAAAAKGGAAAAKGGAAAAAKGGNAAKGAAASKGAAAAAAAAAAKKGSAASGGSKGGATAANAGAGKAAAAATTAAAAAATTTAAAANGQAQGTASVQDPQNSLQLDPSQVMKNLASDGQAVAEAGQVPSATSKNNFINFCLTRPDLVLTDGEQVLDGSCNPTPMGVIIAKAKMPAGKFQFPQNNAVIPANQAFTIKLAVQNLNTGHFVNPQTNYYAAPANTDSSGLVVAHSHVTVQQIPSLDSTAIPDPTVFQFFKGFNAAAVNGVLTADVTAGLAAGVYRMCSIHTAANHMPVLAAVAQHGNFDDCSYFTCTDGGNAGGAAAGGAAAASTTAAAAATSSAAAGSGKAAGAGAAAGGAAAGAGAAKGGAAGAGAAKGGAAGAGAAKGGAAGAGAAKGGAAGAGAAKGGAAAKGGKGRGRGGRGRGRGRWARDLTARED